jgi:hypothetical protein
VGCGLIGLFATPVTFLLVGQGELAKAVTATTGWPRLDLVADPTS